MPKKVKQYRHPTAITTERRLRAFELRKAGYTYREIGAELGIAHSLAHNLVMGALRDYQATTREDMEDVRQLEVERLDAMLKGVISEAMLGDKDAIDSSLRVMKRRAELLGLDAPKRISYAEEFEGMTDEELRIEVARVLGPKLLTGEVVDAEPEGGE